MPITDETCIICGGPLKFGARITTTHCGNRCRVRHFRQRERTRKQTVARYGGPDPADFYRRLWLSEAAIAFSTDETRAYLPALPAQPGALAPFDINDFLELDDDDT